MFEYSFGRKFHDLNYFKIGFFPILGKQRDAHQLSITSLFGIYHPMHYGQIFDQEDTLEELQDDETYICASNYG